MAIHLTADDITIINCNIYTNNHVYTKKNMLIVIVKNFSTG